MGTEDETLKITREHMGALFSQLQAAKSLQLRAAAEFEADRAKRLNAMASMLKEKLGEDHPDVRKLFADASKVNARISSLLQASDLHEKQG